MSEPAAAWVVRPYPHGSYRMKEFLASGIAAIGWPELGDLSGCDRDGIRSALHAHGYGNAGPQAVGQTVGIIDRFVNKIELEHAVLVPDGTSIHVGIVEGGYVHRNDKVHDGYPHWISVSYKQTVPRMALPAALHNSMKGRQTVYGAPAEHVVDLLNNPEKYLAAAVPIGQQASDEYRKRLAEGTVSGVNSDSFENLVGIVLSKVLPTIERLPTTNAPAGADTDLLAQLPGSFALRVQVKCFQDKNGLLTDTEVQQLRGSMSPGDHGIVVTSGGIGKDAEACALEDPERPIALMSGDEFTDLILANIEQFTPEELYRLGFCIAVR